MLLTTKTSSTGFWVCPFANNSREKPLKNGTSQALPGNPYSRTSLFPSSVSHISIGLPPKASVLSANRTRNIRSIDNNTEIIKFCELGNLDKAMELLFKYEKLKLDARTYCSLLQLCAEYKSIDNGREVHSIIERNGIETGGVLESKLVFMYVSCGHLIEGRRIFDRSESKNVFLWNLLMNGYAKIGNFKESVNMYYRMLELGIEMNSYTFSCILKCFAALENVVEGEKVHEKILKLGFGSYSAVVNSLISFYFKCGRSGSGQKLFDEMRERDVVSWNSMISGYVANGLAVKGIKFFMEMLRLGVDVDLASMVSALAACASIKDMLLSRAIHAYAVKAGFDLKMPFTNTLLDVYAKCGDMDGAVCVFENMGEQNIVSWTSMIAGYAREGLSYEAIELFHEMRKKGIDPDVFTVTSTLHACACSGSLESGMKVHAYIKEKNMETNLVVSNALMDMFAKCGSMENAEAVFSQMPAKDIVSWNTMIGGYSKNSLANEALSLFAKMQPHKRPDDVTVTCILPACASLAALDRGQEIHGYILRNGLSSDHFVVNALIDMYVKCGALVMAKLLFRKILSKDLVSWTIMIAGYAMHGFGTEAVATFRKMRQAGIEPDEVSFISILYACSHSGLLDEGWRFFNIMRNEFYIEPNLEHYTCMVDLLARAGKLSKAYKFIKGMPIEPDATVWGALLCGCRIYHDVDMAEKVAEHVFELEPENTGHYVLLANIYAEAEKWEEVKRLQEKIGKRALKKNSGCSWIEIRGKAYIFVSGDSAFPQAKSIKFLLRDLRRKMNEQGHSSKQKYALINEDEIEKEVALCGHSEKLAMAFGVLSLPPSKTIRVTKNLRICGDCHEMAKFISKMLGREILLRDSSRFHHFKDGSCSCRG